MSGTYRQNMKFEEDVRWIAEAVWGLRAGECQPQHYDNDHVVKELDGIARLRDISHLLMVTTSTKLQKVKDDVKKLNAAERIERKTAIAVSKWLITQSQLDAQHIEYARKENVTVLTLDQFKSRFFDGRSYLRKRDVGSFGSARNPKDNAIEIDRDSYVPLPMRYEYKRLLEKGGRGKEEIVSKSVNVKDICRFLNEGEMVVLVAPFGSGKSLTTMEIYHELAASYLSERNSLVPVCLNLREHWGQGYFDEILERHARSIGFTPKEDLVIAWRSGMVTLLLDGFDELASQSIVRKDELNFMKDARKQALSGVRDFISKTPKSSGVLICGRDHYFDDDREMCSALGISGKDYKLIRLDEFSESGANEFLRKNGYSDLLPEWLPKKPLILSYLIQNSLLREILDIDGSQGFGYAWNNFIEKITNREAELEKASMDSLTVRMVMERLAYYVRSLSQGNGPITGNDLAAAYHNETGQSAGEGVLAQLQRLPGLTQRHQEAGSRSFVDQDMLSALQGGALSRFVLNEFEPDNNIPLFRADDRSVEMAVYCLWAKGVTTSTVTSVMGRLSKDNNNAVNHQLMADCFLIACGMAKLNDEPVDFNGLVVDGGLLGEIDFEEIAPRNVIFDSCQIEMVNLGDNNGSSSVQFRNCIINRIKGVADESALSAAMFGDSNDINNFDELSTNSAVLNSDLDARMKALLTILRKLYRQAGAGRKMSALMRGVTKPEVASFISPIIDIMEKNGFVRIYNQVVHPVRKNASRVDVILGAPSLCDDILVLEVMKI